MLNGRVTEEWSTELNSSPSELCPATIGSVLMQHLPYGRLETPFSTGNTSRVGIFKLATVIVQKGLVSFSLGQLRHLTYLHVCCNEHTPKKSSVHQQL